MPLRVSVIGDSISTFDGCNPAGFAVYYEGERARFAGLLHAGQTWWSQVVAAMGAELCSNASWSGSMVEGAGMPAGESAGRIEALCGPDGADPDAVLVFMGTNDYGWGSARAQAAARVAAVPPATDLAAIPPSQAGLAPADGLAGFEAAYRRMLDGVAARFPQADTICLTLLPGRVEGSARPTFCHNLRGVPLGAYNDAIRRAAAAAGARVADVAAFGLDYEAVDGTHPTARGMRQLAAMACAALTGRPLDPEPFLQGPAGEPAAVGVLAPHEGWASANLCPQRPCVGCAHARGTGNAWSCVCTKQLA